MLVTFPRDFLSRHNADLKLGSLLGPGCGSNFVGRTLDHIYFSATLEAATWGAELASAGHALSDRGGAADPRRG